MMVADREAAGEAGLQKGVGVKRGKVRQGDVDVDDILGDQAGHGGRADMVDQGCGGQGGQQTGFDLGIAGGSCAIGLVHLDTYGEAFMARYRLVLGPIRDGYWALIAVGARGAGHHHVWRNPRGGRVAAGRHRALGIGENGPCVLGGVAELRGHEVGGVQACQ